MCRVYLKAGHVPCTYESENATATGVTTLRAYVYQLCSVGVNNMNASLCRQRIERIL